MPLVFYQGVASGLMAPVGATPNWLAWINNVLPLPEMATGLRTILIGGPAGSVPWVSTSVTAVAAMTLIVAGTVVASFVCQRRLRLVVPAEFWGRTKLFTRSPR